MVGGKETSVDVLFESCCFEKGGRAATVDSNGSVTMMNCFAHNLASGVLVSNGGNATLIHTHIFDMELYGLSVESKGGIIQLYVCLIRCSVGGIRAIKCEYFSMCMCVVDECSMVAIHPLREAKIQRCCFTKCMFGVLVQGGRSDVTISACEFIGNFISDCAVSDMVSGGSVTLKDINFQRKSWRMTSTIPLLLAVWSH